jgi:hypothetical protein
LKLSHKDILHYSFFPGQIIVLRGTNVTSTAITPDVIYTESTLEKYDRSNFMEKYWNICFRPAYNRHERLLNKSNQANSTSSSTTNSKKVNLFSSNEQQTTTIADEESSVTTTTTQDNTNPIPTCQEVSKLIQHRSVKVVTACGPFVSPKGSIQAISSILELIQNEPTYVYFSLLHCSLQLNDNIWDRKKTRKMVFPFTFSVQNELEM